MHDVFVSNHFACEWVQGVECFDFIAEEFDADGEFFVLRNDFYRVAAYPEGSAGERHVVAGVLHFHETFKQLITVDFVTDFERHHPVYVLFRGSQTVYTGHSGDHDDVAAGKQ